MRAFVTIFSFVLATAAACASPSDDEAASPAGPDSGSVEPSDGGAKEAALDDAGKDESRCSPEGWCATDLPDDDLTVRDIWPLEGNAFAIAESRTLGVKVLEWDDASSTWSYIDDNTQNESGYGRYAGTIWAPDPTNVYYTVPSMTIYHGTRASPGAPWKWRRERLEDHAHVPPPDDGDLFGSPIDPTYPRNTVLDEHAPALGVWGTSKDDVYAWAANAIYHFKVGEGGVPAWVTEHVLDAYDPAMPAVVFSAAGTNPDDVWFSGSRFDAIFFGACGLLVHRTPSGYERVADGVVENRRCVKKDDVPMITGWLESLMMVGPNQLLGLADTASVLRISANGDGYSTTTSTPPSTIAPGPWRALWASSDATIWLGRVGIAVRGDDVWADGGYRVSTLARNGAPLVRPIYRIRGTSSTNLWLVGDRHALHKTTP